MNIQYFKSAWGDIKNSPGWFGKLCLLALVNFIPIFGQIVTFAYLYGWAREIAWGTHEPLPRKLFANEDGKFWRRGWFVFVLTFVFAIIAQIIISLGNYCQVAGAAHVYAGVSHGSANPVLGTLGFILVLVGFACALLLNVLAWIGNMRISIYDRLSAGFQFGKLWKMLRHDTTGILKIFGMNLLFQFILGILLAIIFTILMFIVIFAGVAGLMNAGYSPQSIQYMTDAQAMSMLVQFFMSAGLIGLLAILIGSFVALLSTVFVQMLVIRAMGYWTMQFEVPRWAGQDAPMPFESAAGTPSQPQPQQPPVYAAQQPLQPQQQQPYAGEPAQPSYAPSQPQQPYAGEQTRPYDAEQPQQPYDQQPQSPATMPDASSVPVQDAALVPPIPPDQPESPESVLGEVADEPSIQQQERQE